MTCVSVVRIKVYAPGAIGFGSGTIIHSTPEEAIILTCAHIFKMEGRAQAPPSQFPLRITVDLFDGKLTGQKPAMVHYANETYEAKVIDYDFTRDVGLIRIKPGRRLPASRVVPPHWTPKARMAMITVGCSEEHDATAWSTSIINPGMKALANNASYEAIECMISPKQGRSGGTCSPPMATSPGSATSPSRPTTTGSTPRRAPSITCSTAIT